MATEQDRGLMQETVVLREVRAKLHEVARPVDVICELSEGATFHQAIDFLTGLGMTVEEKHTDRYLFARLMDEKQASRIDVTSGASDQCIRHVWLDKAMSACVDTSSATINAAAARALFSRGGEGIHWAVLDTGVDFGHSWLTPKTGDGTCLQYNFTADPDGDEEGHGTHVAGIIAAIAPEATLYDYKVLGRQGGSSSTIIKAMYEIRKMNFAAGKSLIHGVNMSLGGPVPVGSYGCGWSPECQEANRLVASGVVVCVAASNDGYKVLATVKGQSLELFPTYLDIGISDPGNAEDVITVGSTHRSQPHTYGPSYFSAKGPTGDGRLKPDCVAPGEKIASAKAGTPNGTITMTGTSMATPHVSGAIALFLSAKPEFIGRAREVKQIMLQSCTDLTRDRYFQGAGLVDVLRMIQSV